MSIFKKDSSFDLEEYLLKKYNLTLDRSSSFPVELQNAIKLEIEKELKKMSAFLGEFKYEIQDGCIRVPWDIDALNDRFIWMRIKYEETEKIVFTYADHNMEAEDGTVLQQDICAFLDARDWIVPPKVLEFLNTEMCIWVGKSGYAELLSETDYNAIYEKQTDGTTKELVKTNEERGMQI